MSDNESSTTKSPLGFTKKINGDHKNWVKNDQEIRKALGATHCYRPFMLALTNNENPVLPIGGPGGTALRTEAQINNAFAAMANEDIAKCEKFQTHLLKWIDGELGDEIRPETRQNVGQVVRLIYAHYLGGDATIMHNMVQGYFSHNPDDSEPYYKFLQRQEALKGNIGDIQPDMMNKAACFKTEFMDPELLAVYDQQVAANANYQAISTALKEKSK